MGELRRRLANRADSEHEQILIRVLIALLAPLYPFGIYLAQGTLSPVLVGCFILGCAYIVGALLLLAHLLWQPGVRPARRYAGMVLDMAALTLVLTIGGDTGPLFYPFYLWVTLGMGFRYGRRYLCVAAVLSLLSFGFVVLTSPFWRQHPSLSAGLLAALVMLPLYASSLLAKLTDAVERAQAASRAKSRFLATMSHELRTPLNAIIGITDLLRAGRLEAEQRDLLNTARIASQHLLEMINDVLDVSKIESGKTDLTVVDFDLHRLLAGLRGLLAHRAASQGVRLDLVIDPRLPHRLRGSERALRQILTNLIANGIKFTAKGAVTVRVEARAVEAGSACALISVEDTGIGIPADALERIFEQFAQVDETTTRRYGGSGLGLTIARQLVGLLGGELRVESTPGQGSRFHFEGTFERSAEEPAPLAGRVVVLGTGPAAAAWCLRIRRLGPDALPVPDAESARQLVAGRERRAAVVVVAAAAEAAHVSTMPGILGGAPGETMPGLILVAAGQGCPPGYLAQLEPEAADDLVQEALHAALVDDGLPQAPFEPLAVVRVPRRILLAEDNPTNQKVIARILERAGHTVVLAEHGEAALDALERERFELVLLDLNMPVMGGLDAARLYRFCVPEAEQVPLVALTADVTEETRAGCAAAGITEILTKPLDAATLLAVIDRVSAGATMARGRPPAGAAEPVPPGDNVILHLRRSRVIPTLDHSHIERLMQLDQDDGFFAEVVRGFLVDARELVDELHAEAARADSARFRDRAHALRSSAAHIGGRALVELCLECRGISSRELKVSGKTLCARLSTEFEQLERALLALLDSQPPPYPEGRRRELEDELQVRQPLR